MKKAVFFLLEDIAACCVYFLVNWNCVLMFQEALSLKPLNQNHSKKTKTSSTKIKKINNLNDANMDYDSLNSTLFSNGVLLKCFTPVRSPPELTFYIFKASNRSLFVLVHLPSVNSLTDWLTDWLTHSSVRIMPLKSSNLPRIPFVAYPLVPDLLLYI